jgi:hypothetical protein
MGILPTPTLSDKLSLTILENYIQTFLGEKFVDEPCEPKIRSARDFINEKRMSAI